tara:strand:- start:15794 stop:16177 length:384 start_codon:yes stop_codon:yes gene_type:complete
MRVLIVEDIPLLRLTYEEFVADLGHTVISVGDGLAALAVLRAEPVDVMVTDLHMPRLDGYELLRIVVVEFPAVVCIIASAFTQETAAARLGPILNRLAGLLQKPFPFSALERVLVDAERRLALGDAA